MVAALSGDSRFNRFRYLLVSFVLEVLELGVLLVLLVSDELLLDAGAVEEVDEDEGVLEVELLVLDVLLVLLGVLEVEPE